VLQWFGFKELWAQNIKFTVAGADTSYVIFGLHACNWRDQNLLVMLLKAFFGKQNCIVRQK
jgi:hypothetical protein